MGKRRRLEESGDSLEDVLEPGVRDRVSGTVRPRKTSAWSECSEARTAADRRTDRSAMKHIPQKSEVLYRVVWHMGKCRIERGVVRARDGGGFVIAAGKKLHEWDSCWKTSPDEAIRHWYYRLCTRAILNVEPIESVVERICVLAELAAETAADRGGPRPGDPSCKT